MFMQKNILLLVTGATVFLAIFIISPRALATIMSGGGGNIQGNVTEKKHVSASNPPRLLTKEELSHKSSVVIVGKNIGVNAVWNKKDRLIFTESTYDVEQKIKGAVSTKQKIKIKTLGGTVGRITQTAVDGPQMRFGSRDILFLEPSGELGSYKIVGFNQGKLPILRDQSSGAEFVLDREYEDTVQRQPFKKELNRSSKQNIKIPKARSAKDVIEELESYVQ